jgi:large-conductance mechanosensitive channel
MQRQKAEAPSPPEPTAQEKLLTEIRDLLRAR